MIFTQLIQTNLRTKELGKNVEYYNRLDSTNEEAWELIDEDSHQHGSIVITENQIKGKGRQKNKWSMVAGKGLAFTLILDKKYPSSYSSFFSLAAGISVAQSLKKRGVLSVLKWPNDIYSSDKKIGGILCESKVKKNEIEKIVIGIGLNVNETIEEHPDNLHNDISTMFSITNHSHQRELIVAEFVNYFEKLLNNIPENSRVIIDEWQNLCMHMNQSILFHVEQKARSGVFIGLNKDGYAKIKIDGKTKTFSSIDLI